MKINWLLIPAFALTLGTTACGGAETPAEEAPVEEAAPAEAPAEEAAPAEAPAEEAAPAEGEQQQ